MPQYNQKYTVIFGDTMSAGKMTPNEMKLEYPWGRDIPDPGHYLEVAPGVRWIRMPLPFALNHINLWLIRDNFNGVDGWTLVDCGVSRDEVKELWAQIFEKSLDGLPIVRVIVTHMHPDHVGLAGWLCEHWNAPLYMSMTDYVNARLFSMPHEANSTSGPNGPAAAKFFSIHGLDDVDSQEKIKQRATYYQDLVPSVPTSYARLMHDDQIDIGANKWRVIVGYGHAPEHVSLYCETHKVLISGDMLLPRISTNVSVFNYEPMANPLPLYLNSLDKYNDLHQDTLVLPSHGHPFKGIHERISQQHQHHKERLEEVLQACENPINTKELIPIMFRRELDLHQLTFAMGEALAHLHALYFEGKLKRLVDDKGVISFVVADK